MELTQDVQFKELVPSRISRAALFVKSTGLAALEVLVGNFDEEEQIMFSPRSRQKLGQAIIKKARPTTPQAEELLAKMTDKFGN